MTDRPGPGSSVMRRTSLLAALAAAGGCESAPLDPREELVLRGERVFFFETFAGNGRTCGSCHRAERNFGIDAAFIATLPPDDPLFVAERNPNLKQNFENPRLMRELGLILENQDGFEDISRKFNMRGVPHTLAQRTSVESAQGPRTGWSGDGSPGDGSLRSFATGAVIQHFTKTLDRVPGVDFRLPDDQELNALEAFLLSLGRQEDLVLPLPLKGAVPRRGQEIFMDDAVGKCNICHFNAGANARLGGQLVGNANFNTGVEDLPDQPADLTGAILQPDDGFGIPGDGTFNTPPLVEAADTGPFFHNNSVSTIEGAVGFYDGDAFNNSPAGKFLAASDPEGNGIEIDATQITAIAAFLRVINALENIRETMALLERSTARGVSGERASLLLRRAAAENGDAIEVLEGGLLHPDAVAHLRAAATLIDEAARGSRRSNARRAADELRSARSKLVG